MVFTGNYFEFRGYEDKISKDGNKHYFFVNLEDLYGESCKFLCNPIENWPNKGDTVVVRFDYSSKYGSLRVIDLEVTDDEISNI